ncbi:MAG: cyanophycin synthetase [Gemmataceae bacterium]
MIGLDIAGVDIVVSDISQPLEKQRGGVVEVNAGPGLRMHLQPSAGKPRPVGEAIVDLLFPGRPGRPYPGGRGHRGERQDDDHPADRPDAPRHRQGGRHDLYRRGVHLRPGDGRRVPPARRPADRQPRLQRTAQRPRVLLNPRVEAAVLETARGGILRRGLGFDRCDVAVVTNLGTGDHFGSRGVETLPELARVKCVVVEAVAPTGAAVLNAADPLVAEMASACPGAVVYFARDEAIPVLASHRNAGGRAVFVRNGAVVLAEGHREETLIALTDVPLTHGGKVAFEVENVLAAVAAGWSLRVPNPAMRLAAETFAGDGRQLPGRFNVYRNGGATVIVDYAHNPSALAALIGALAAFPAERRSIVFCPGNRRDSDVEEMGALLGDGFDRMHLFRDHGNPDRADGELVGILRKGMAGGKRLATVSEAPSEREAIAAAFHDLRSGDLLVVNVEAIDAALSWVEGHLHRSEADRPWHARQPTRGRALTSSVPRPDVRLRPARCADSAHLVPFSGPR